jgi:tetratricopeptide (TPR) repeat protein
MIKSSFYVESRPLTRADELRHQLDELEAKLGRLGHGLGQEALSIPLLFDTVTTTLASFQAEGQSMRAEWARLETASAALRRKATVFLREVGGARALQDARRTHQPPAANWWWFLDRMVADKLRAQLRRLLVMAAGAVGVLLLLLALYQRFLAPDPATRARLEHEQAAENLVLEGDLAAALSEVEQALATAPGDPSLLIFKGGLQQGLGQKAAAKETFSQAEAAFGDRETFLLARGQMYLRLDQAQAALSDAEAVVKVNPESASGYLLLGRANEWLENYQQAIAAYEQAANLADAQGNSQIAALARVNMGVLMQRLPLQQGEGN